MIKWLESKFLKRTLDSEGVAVGNIHSETPHRRLLICLLRGILTFLAAYGTIGGLMEAMEIPYNRLLVAGYLLFFSLLCTVLYMRKIAFYIGYIIILIVYTIELAKYYYYANSGFQAITNIIYEKYSDFFNLLSIRQAQEFYADRYVTVTVALLFIGLFLILLLNVTISGYMNVFETVLITFPFLELALYIGKKPPIIFIGMVLITYISVGLMQFTKYSRMPIKGKNTKEYSRVFKKRENVYAYQGSFSGNVIAVCVAVIISAVVCFVSLPAYSTAEVNKFATNPVRSETDSLITRYIQTGFLGFFNKYQSKGGLSSGRLGGVSSVRPDFQTDLYVTFAPYSAQTVYLKAFEGSYYAINTFYEDAIKKDETGALEYFITHTQIDAIENKNIVDVGNRATMVVENVDADFTRNYLPYYPIEDSIKTDDKLIDKVNFYNDNTAPGQEYIVTFSPVVYNDYPVRDDKNLHYDQYKKYIETVCLQIPDELQEGITKHFDEMEDKSLRDAKESDYSDVNEYRQQMVNLIYQDYFTNFEYTMSPGSTPYSSDVVDYFINESRRGYCAHFASSAVMMLRAKGVPARYVEGYCVPIGIIEESGKIQPNLDIKDWYEGENTLGTDMQVVTVAVNDSYAHAWIEVYLEGYGFVPFEVTPPDFLEENDETLNIANLFNSIFANMNLNIETPDPATPTNNRNTFKKINFNLIKSMDLTLFAPVISVVAAGLIVIVGFALYCRIKQAIIDNLNMKSGNYKPFVYSRYVKILNKFSQKKIVANKNALPKELAEGLEKYIYSLPVDKIKYDSCEMIKAGYEFARITDFVLYSGEVPSAEEMETYREIVKRLGKV